MTQSGGAVRLVGLVGALAVAVVVMAVVLSSSSVGLSALPLRDYVEYWAAGQLLAAGESPYDVEKVGELERRAGREEEPILMWNPPWALPLALPLGWMSVRAGHLAWMAVQLLALVLSTELLWRAYRGPDDWRPLAHLLTLTFVPSGFALLAGQISPLVLLGLAGFLYFVQQRRDLGAGASCVLLAVKPHLLYLFWPALLVWAVAERRWRVLLGGALAGAALTGLALAFRPEVLADYWTTLTTRPPEQYRSPTLGTLLREWAGEGAFRLQFVSVVPGLLWLAALGWSARHQRWDWGERMPMIALVSVITATYGAWLFDLVVLLVPVVAVATRLLREGAGWRRLGAVVGLVAVNLGIFALLLRESEYLEFIWVTPALLAVYGLCALSENRASCSPSPLVGEGAGG